MLWAKTADQERVCAQPSARANCPACDARVIAKCGEIKIWHWAHEASDCDPWAEPETDWHLAWKQCFHPNQVEVPMGNHRADILTQRTDRDVTQYLGVIELQHSSLSVAEIRAREAHYGHMVWILDTEPFKDHLHFRKREGFWSFRWRWPRLSWAAARKPIFLDLREGALFRVQKLHNNAPCGGWGHFYDRHAFIYRAGGTAHPVRALDRRSPSSVDIETVESTKTRYDSDRGNYYAI